tara:strand:+ start:54 stop:476 length:423 start_codon:yes stop_codon:yes gene_type:complete
MKKFKSSYKNVYANKIPYTQEQLNEMFTYKDGKLYHKNYRDRAFRGTDLEGVEAGNTGLGGRSQVKIKNSLYLRSRLIWKMLNGIDPVEVIDHINNDCTNDRIENLRDISQRDNRWEGKTIADKLSGGNWAEVKMIWQSN